MHILVATDGSSDINETAKFAFALAGPDGETTVATIVPIPRQLVSELREQWGEPEQVAVDTDAEYVGAPDTGGAMRKSYPGDDAVVEQYLGNKRVEVCRPVREAIRALGGRADSQAREGTDITAGIMELAAEIDADAIVIGSHGHGAFQGLLGSTGAKLVRRAKRPVLVLR
ncbi:MAG: universal stress protein [Acidimicrobiia bacterium]